MKLGNVPKGSDSPVEKKEFKLITNGEYVVKLANVFTKQSKDGNSSYAELTFVLIDGEFDKRRLWKKFFLEHPNKVCVEISEKDQEALEAAAGEKIDLSVNGNVTQDIKVLAKVSTEPAKNGFKARNKIVGFMSL